MSDFKKSFIFRKRQRRLTVLSVLALAPLFIAALSVLFLQLGLFNALATNYINLLVSIPNWGLGLVYVLFPLMSIYYSFRLAKRGTLHNLRSFNRTVGIVGIFLILMEVGIIIIG